MGLREGLTIIGAVIGSFWGQPQIGAMIGSCDGRTVEVVDDEGLEEDVDVAP
jgi:hypothetical protein